MRKSGLRPNHIPWYDILLMLMGAGAFMYFAFNALDIIKLATRIEPVHVVLAVIGVISLVERCRLCHGWSYRRLHRPLHPGLQPHHGPRGQLPPRSSTPL